MRKRYAVLLIVFMMLLSCGFDIIYDPHWDLTAMPDPEQVWPLVQKGHGFLSFVRRLFGADRTGPEKITAGPVSPAVVLAGIVCVLVLITAVSYFLIRKKTESRRAS